MLSGLKPNPNEKNIKIKDEKQAQITTIYICFLLIRLKKFLSSSHPISFSELFTCRKKTCSLFVLLIRINPNTG